MQSELNAALLKAAKLGKLNTVKRLLGQGADPGAKDALALLDASLHGHLEIVKLLLSLFDPTANDSWAPKMALAMAAKGGHMNIVKALLPLQPYRPVRRSGALEQAAANGHIGIVELLLPSSDPKANNSWALCAAAENGHLEIAKLLFPLSDVAAVLEQSWFVSSAGCDMLLSCLPRRTAEDFVERHPELDLPRTYAVWAASDLGSREVNNHYKKGPRRRA